MTLLQFPGVHTTESSDDPVVTVIERLEELLKRAKDGQIRALVYATVDKQRNIEASWASDGRSCNDIAAAALDIGHEVAHVRRALSKADRVL